MNSVFSFIEIIGHLSQALFIIASGFRKLLFLRIGLIAASVLEIIYFLFEAPQPVWSPIVWSIAMIVLNAYQIIRIAYEKKFLRLSKDEVSVFSFIGHKMDLLNFKKIIRSGRWIKNETLQEIIQEDVYNNKLYFIVHGEATLAVKGKSFSTIGKGNFLGEMSFLTGNKTSASVSVLPGATLIFWEAGSLQILMEKDHTLKNEFYGLLSNDLVLKIVKSNEQFTTYMIISQPCSHCFRVHCFIRLMKQVVYSIKYATNFRTF
jgi:hypothetical protein